jgi:CRP-like cAMP-binding protein
MALATSAKTRLEISGTLSKTALFAALKQEALESMLEDPRCRLKEYDQGQIIHLEGEICREAELILSGEISIERISEQGQLLNVARFRQGDLLGGNLLFSGNSRYPMTVTVRCKANVLILSGDLLLDLMLGSRDFLQAFLAIISDNTSVLSQKIRQTVHRSIRSRLLEYIDLQIKQQGSRKIRLKVSKKELAETFGIQRTSLSRELRRMKQAGLLDFDSQTITLL